MYSPEMERIPCVIMRSGTSKGIYLLSNDLPEDPEPRDKVILSIFGSPDSRQIDGLGGADPLTSKLAIISVSDREDADIDYTFGQVEIKKPYVDYSSNCGNISAGVGPFAIQQGLVRAVEPVTTVRIYNTNTKKVFVAEVPVKNGKPQVKGGYKVDGVPGTGARIGINMAGTIGAKTGRLLPTGNAMDTLDIKGFGLLPVSMLDAGSPMVFVRAKDLGLKGTESPVRSTATPKCWSCWRRFAPRRRWSWALPRIRKRPAPKSVRSQWWRSYHLRRTTPATLMGHRFPRTILISYPGICLWESCTRPIPVRPRSAPAALR